MAEGEWADTTTSSTPNPLPGNNQSFIWKVFYARVHKDISDVIFVTEVTPPDQVPLTRWRPVSCPRLPHHNGRYLALFPLRYEPRRAALRTRYIKGISREDQNILFLSSALSIVKCSSTWCHDPPHKMQRCPPHSHPQSVCGASYFHVFDDKNSFSLRVLQNTLVEVIVFITAAASEPAFVDISRTAGSLAKVAVKFLA